MPSRLQFSLMHSLRYFECSTVNALAELSALLVLFKRQNSLRLSAFLNQRIHPSICRISIPNCDRTGRILSIFKRIHPTCNMTVDAELSRPQIVIHAQQSVTYTPYQCLWVPCSAKMVVVGQHARGTGALQIYELSSTELKQRQDVPAFFYLHLN